MILNFIFFEISEQVSGLPVELVGVASCKQYFLLTIHLYFHMLHSGFENGNDNYCYIRGQNMYKPLEDYGYF